MPGRRRRGLSVEERALWAQVTAGAKPLRPEPVATPETGATPVPSPRAPARRAALPRQLEPGRVTVDLAPDPAVALARANPHMDRRRFEKLRRGRFEPEARLDLHGLGSERAHAALTAFILGAHAAGLRLVLVITGKGRAPAEDAVLPRHGILRHSLPHWLAAPPLVARVLQVTPAHARHGGAGAYYVYLRRQRGYERAR